MSSSPLLLPPSAWSEHAYPPHRSGLMRWCPFSHRALFKVKMKNVFSLCTFLGLGAAYLVYLHPILFVDYESQPDRPLVPNPESFGQGDDPGLFALDPLTRQIDRTKKSDQKLIEVNRAYDNVTRFDALEKIVGQARQQLSKGFQDVWIPSATLNCSLSDFAQNRYQAYFLTPTASLSETNCTVKREHKIILAINLHASQKVLPSLAQAILSLITYLGPRSLLVSIYENGSWDHTLEGLRHLEIVLSSLGVEHVFRSKKEDTQWSKVDRISQLAHYRNQALLNGLEHSERIGMNITEVVFVNDVYVCPQDILELIYQKHVQKASASCGTDWRSTISYLDRFKMRTQKSIVFYDSWVARSISGQTFRPRLDLLTEWRDGFKVLFDQESGPQGDWLRRRVRSSLPVPVYSCWNGLIALDARPFKLLSSSSTSATKKPERLIKFRSANRSKGECRSSECQLLAKDFWSVGFQRWVLVPRVAVTYDEEMYHEQLVEDGSRRDFRDYSTLGVGEQREEDELIDWKKFKVPEKVVCWPDMSSTHLDFEWNQVLEPPLNADLVHYSTHTHDLEAP